MHGTQLSIDGAPSLDLRNVNVKTTKVHTQTEHHKVIEPAPTPAVKIEQSEGEAQEGEEN